MTTYPTKDGHIVKSRAEWIIDDILTDMGLKHDYEKEIKFGDIPLHPDWCLLTKDILIIEFWGMENKLDYIKNQNRKLKLYAGNNIPCLSLNDKDLEGGNDFLIKKISDFVKKYSSNLLDKLDQINIQEKERTSENVIKAPLSGLL